jgi:hypothetical protein
MQDNIGKAVAFLIVLALGWFLGSTYPIHSDSVPAEVRQAPAGLQANLAPAYVATTQLPAIITALQKGSQPVLYAGAERLRLFDLITDPLTDETHFEADVLAPDGSVAGWESLSMPLVSYYLQGGSYAVLEGAESVYNR